MNKFKTVIGKILSAIFAGVAAAFLIGLMALKLLPTVVVLAIGGVLAVLLAGVLLLTWTGRGKVKMTVGIILAILAIGVLVVGTVYVYKTLDTIDRISDVETETVHMAIYVLNENAEVDIETAAGFRYGILWKLDRTSTDKALEELAETLGQRPVCWEYDKLTDLVDALLDKQVEAIVLNKAYLDLLQEMEGYEDILSRIHELFLQKIEVEVEGETTPETQPTTPEQEEQEPDLLAPFIMYISGIDTYGSVSVRSRSDVNILAVVNPKTRQVALISTPRDYYVPLSISDGIPDKLTHAGIYGVNVSKTTLEMLYDTKIEYYFRINFSGFTKLIDALGGITVHSQYAFKSGKHTFVKGLNTMDGRQALAFCRERYALSGGDRQRGKNQMAVIQGVIDKALSPALLTKYTQVLDAVTGTFETSMPMEIVGAITAAQLKNGGAWNVVTYSVDGTVDYQIPYSMSQSVYVMQPDYETVERAKMLIQKVYNGEILDSK